MTRQNFAVDLDEATYQAVIARATQEGKTAEQVLVELITAYAQGTTPGGFTTYTVQSGDTLSRIAQKLYGDPHQYPLIQKANNLPDGRIWVGQVLIIPALELETVRPVQAPE